PYPGRPLRLHRDQSQRTVPLDRARDRPAHHQGHLRPADERGRNCIMNDSLRQAVVDGLDYLWALQRERARPDAARGPWPAGRQSHPGMAIDLFEEEEAYDRSVHYDLLLRRAGEGTVTLSYSPERAVPWPLRGVHRWSEAHLVRVNGTVLKVDQAIALLDFIWD